jgi:AraC-like DNA-binding protein
LHLVRNGPVVMEHRDSPPLEILEPSLVFYPRPFDHRLVIPPDNLATLLCADVRFNFADRNPVALALPDVMVVPLDEETGLSPTLSLLFGEAEVEDIGKNLVMDHLCDVLVIHLVRYARRMKLIRTGAVAGLSDVQIAPVLAALHAEAGRAWSVEDMAVMARMSRTTFINRFRDVVGQPPAEYLANWRMELAKSYLREGRSVKEIAQAVGYSYQPGFTKAFISRFGMAPRDWLKQSE